MTAYTCAPELLATRLRLSRLTGVTKEAHCQMQEPCVQLLMVNGHIRCLQVPVGEWARSVEELPFVSAYGG